MTTGKPGAWGLRLRSLPRASEDKPLFGLSTAAPQGAKVESSQTMSKSVTARLCQRLRRVRHSSPGIEDAGGRAENILQTVVLPEPRHAQSIAHAAEVALRPSVAMPRTV